MRMNRNERTMSAEKSVAEKGKKKWRPGELEHVYRIIRGNPNMSLKELEKKYFCPSGADYKSKLVLEYEVCAFRPAFSEYHEWELIDARDWERVKYNTYEFCLAKHTYVEETLEDACTVYDDPVEVQVLVEKHDIGSDGPASRFVTDLICPSWACPELSKLGLS